MSLVTYVFKPLAYVSLPVYALHKFAEASPFARYYIRLGLYLSTLGLCSLWGAIVSVSMSLVGQRFNANFVTARSFYYLVSRVIDMRVEVEGEEHLENRPVVLIGNHQSMLDVMILGRVFPKRASIMAKKELQWAPLLGQFMQASGAIFVDRGNNAKAIRSLTAAGETMKARNTSVWLYPEGTRSMRPYHDMLPFKKGAFHLAVNAGVPIVPVVTSNYYHLYGKGVFESGTIRVKVLPPIPTKGVTAADVNDFSARVREIMVEALREISGPEHPSSDTKSSKSLPAFAEPPPSFQQQQHTDPLIATAPSPIELESQPESRSESRASTSLMSEPSSPALSRHGESENGVETEEDEGMVLVGRPKA